MGNPSSTLQSMPVVQGNSGQASAEQEAADGGFLWGWREWAALLLFLAGLHLTRVAGGYLLFHSLAELFSVAIAVSVFVLAMNCWEYIRNPYLLVIGVSYLFVGLLDTLHTLAFKGMGVFTSYDYYAPQFWIAARAMEAASTLFAFSLIGRRKRLNRPLLLGGYAAVSAGLIASILVYRVFPVCFVKGHGLTRFKVDAEYTICAVLVLSLAQLYRHRQTFEAYIRQLVGVSIVLAIAMELCFTLYVTDAMSDTFNEIGHLLKIVVFYAIYRAVVVTGLRKPTALLFRELHQSELGLLESLQRVNRELHAISTCNQTLLRATEEQPLLDEVCRIVCEEAGYRMAWVGYVEQDEAKTVRPVAWAGVEEGYLAKAKISWANTERGRGATGSAVRTGKSSCFQDFRVDPNAAPWRDQALQRGYRSTISLPLKDEDTSVFAALTIYSTEPNAFTAEEIRLLEELAGDLAFGIVVLRGRGERRRAEERIRYLASIVESTDDAVLGKTLEGEIASWNRGAEQLYGYTAQEIIGQPISVLIPSDLQVEFDDVMARLKTGENIHHLETQRICKGEKVIAVSLTICPIKDDNGRLIGASTIAHDITGRKRAEEEIRKLNADLEERVRQRTAQLEAANKELESFSYTVSHDLRGPLRSIDGFSQMLLDAYGEKFDDRGKQYIHRVRTGVARMSRLIDDILSLSRVSCAEMQLEKVNLSTLVQETIGELMRREPERKAVFAVAPDVAVAGDPRFLRIALENLLGNAWKFTGRCSETQIEFGVTEMENRAVYFVRDNGAGFDMRYAGRLFGTFQRLHTESEFPGTGIGLATVQRIIDKHGGQIWAESEVGKGATFFFTLDVAS